MMAIRLKRTAPVMALRFGALVFLLLGLVVYRSFCKFRFLSHGQEDLPEGSRRDLRLPSGGGPAGV